MIIVAGRAKIFSKFTFNNLTIENFMLNCLKVP